MTDITTPEALDAQAVAWDEGYISGHSRAMRRMSDEPNVEPGRNPYRALLYRPDRPSDRAAEVEIGGEVMTQAQFDAARFPLLHHDLGSVVHGDEHVMTFDAPAPVTVTDSAEPTVAELQAEAQRLCDADRRYEDGAR